MGRCPPGVICIENITILIILIVVAIIGLFFHIQNKNNQNQNQTQNKPSTENIIIQEQPPRRGLFPRPSFSFSNVSEDVLMNPYVAPLKNDQFFPNGGGDPRGVPINIPTRSGGYESSYRQVGILTRINGPETILSLMGRPLYSNRHKWQYYTMSDSQNNIKLPVSSQGKSCTAEYGCDEIYNGDSVYIEGYNDAFKVTMYDNAVMRYIPY